jgi:hypothetical protein
MAVVGIIQDGVWVPIEDGQPPVHQTPDTRVIDPSASDVDKIVMLLGEIVRLAQGLNPADARRTRDFMHTAQSMLTATTFLNGSDQNAFERSLRGEVTRQGER